MNIVYGIFFVGLLALIIAAIRTMEFLKVDVSGTFYVSEKSTIFGVTATIVNIGFSTVNIEDIAVQLKDNYPNNAKRIENTKQYILKGMVSRDHNTGIIKVHATNNKPRRVNIVFDSKNTLRLLNIAFKVDHTINKNCIDAILIIITNTNILTKSMFYITGGIFAKKKFKFKFYQNIQ